ncbi:tRNA preQ1(34) S-adenosylmethionine ribosyltransferase-isomerase QueA [Symbiobacterium thermophilum]|uniref:S-adenosylmethionine:tRNA ribosyltransferase-isomerase n=1 Tax=Symbiobacterium thermophilum TaxID=2734 RepID=A0A953I982_SYMTR|nr:tRNA preQ1(34) S-adenosylmethionine ribosyltransferase-isomerase QueA [Symbiobacterium thermophilum]MBY6276778.1 tRNA preQ1(34) S-adenosylmethionine ribosyltransferase-isomerase QueA [Symbiobacterium thermophilum]
MRLSDFDYDLPKELIAQKPVEPRDASRLMVVHRASGAIEHRCFRDLPEYLRPGDGLVINETRVMPARLLGSREKTGGAMEVLLLKRLDRDRWETLVKPGKKARPGERIVFGDGLLVGTVVGPTDYGGRVIDFHYEGVFENLLERLGQMPLPPYIHEQLEEPERYQTVYAREWGSAAAPTAGLHFTAELLDRLAARGVEIHRITLHVGLGTFRPVEVEDPTQHKMHSEFYHVSPEAAAGINAVRKGGGRLVAVGTTSVRTLETVADEDGTVRPGEGWTDIFIYPGYRFKAVDALVTNFHLPKSTLLMLVSALAGHDLIMRAYREAVAQRYRFFSFGDAMLIL